MDFKNRLLVIVRNLKNYVIHYLLSPWFSIFATKKSNNNLIQNFSLPSPIIYHIMEKCTLKTLSKLYNTCKYFYVKKRIIIVDEFDLYDQGFNIAIQKRSKVMTPDQLCNKKVGVTKEIFCDAPEGKLLSEFIKSIVKCDIQHLNICLLPPLTWQEFEFLATTVTKLSINHLKIVECDNQTPPLDGIILRAPNAKILNILPCRIASETSKNLIRLKQNQKFTDIGLYEIHGAALDPLIFYQFIRKNAAPKCKINIEGVNSEFRFEFAQKFSLWCPRNEYPYIKFEHPFDN